MSELSGLNSLRGKLEIKWLDSLRDNAKEVESAKVLLEKQHLQELELRWCHDEETDKRLNKQENNSRLKDKILQGLQPHHSIKRLVIDGYCGKSLPDWKWNLSSLLSLEISNCNGLESLPGGIRNLVSLQRLCYITAHC
ncbi:hypothetical protein JHK85_010328 [Glycine max]|nr:hypothetical protein JHK85_010328 [Glycine max]